MFSIHKMNSLVSLSKKLLMKYRKQRKGTGKIGLGFLLGVIYVMVLSWFLPLVYDEYILWFHDLFRLVESVVSR